MICFCRNTRYAGLQTFSNWRIVMEFRFVGINSTRCLVIEYKENINFYEQQAVKMQCHFVVINVVGCFGD